MILVIKLLRIRVLQNVEYINTININIFNKFTKIETGYILKHIIEKIMLIFNFIKYHSKNIAHIIKNI
jgi:ribosome biogenesis SPOUT family RNA methylase Rps3